MDRKQLDIINFKNRIWLLFILIPITFALFILAFIVYSLFRTSENQFGFIIPLLVFLIEMKLLGVIFSRFRYIPDGHLIFNENGIFKDKSSDNFNYSWEEINEIRFYYRGDRFWRQKVGCFTLNRGSRRYHNLHWIGIKDLDERIIDRIDINGKKIYIKIRNKTEKNIFQGFISLSKEKKNDVKIIETDFTTKIFSKSIDI